MSHQASINITERADKYQVLLLVLGLAGFSLMTFVPGGASSIVFRFVFLLLATGFVVKTVVQQRFVFNWPWAIFVLFWVLYSIRLIHDVSVAPEQLARPPADYLLFGLLVCFFCSHAFFSTVSAPTLNKALSWILVILFVVCLLSINNFARNLSEFNSGRAWFTEKANPISSSIYGALLIISSVYILVDKPAGIRFPKLFLFAAIITGAVVLVLTASKSPLIGLVLNLFLLLKSNFRKYFFKILIGLCIGLVLFQVISAYLGLSDFIEIFLTRMVDYENDHSTGERRIIYANAVNLFTENPLFGGFSVEPEYKEYPHNLVLESFMALGVFGGIVFILLYLTGLYAALQLVHTKAYKWVGFFFIEYFVVSNFSGGICFFYDFWYTYALATAIYIQLAYNSRHSFHRQPEVAA